MSTIYARAVFSIHGTWFGEYITTELQIVYDCCVAKLKENEKIQKLGSETVKIIVDVEERGKV